MSWNEPGGDKKDPWGGRKDENGPPDLDEVIRSLQEKLGGIFGGGGADGGDSRGGSLKSLRFLIIGAFVLWGLSGFYIVDEGTRGVETRFGAYTLTTQPGLNWHFPTPIDTVQIVDVQNVQIVEVGYRSGGRQGIGSVPREALMLTKDENIVDVRLAVQYQVKDAKDYAFNVLNPTATLKQVTEGVERGVIGRSTMDFVLTEGRSEIVAGIQTEIQKVMDSYQSGVLITTVNLQDAQPPEQVQGAFEDAIKAREDEQRLINEAEAYSNEVVPVARGAASRKVQEAEAYKERVIAQAIGEVSRFSQLLKEYKKAPKVTRQRIYLESMEQVLSKTSTIMIDVKGGNNLLYLPLDKLGNQTSTMGAGDVTNSQSPTRVTSSTNSNSKIRTSNRGRDVRGR
ncbi:MAG: FtsH protease activity modulator HflK [Methylococcales symbiont of Hymedesmia sp. n. MRB-2018]|nr:MAG: FtsH protease activity modulator HflK [Methylococcales symbiont of Hymedesmia sp. n. MRB-2018]KAF3983122.1 MAG: FtsH protease activity modulator HflK [Methylococcales symbiont of Hymedesmia sp. n. MRB-2018]